MLRFTENFYKATVEEDARRFAVTPPSLDDLRAPLKDSIELDEPRVLAAGRVIETPHLKIGAVVLKEWAGGGGQGFRYEHLVLTITNRAKVPVAYRVDTLVSQPDRCRSKGIMGHNAFALAPDEIIQRTECLWHKGATLTVQKVEVVELTPLGYHYVSRLVPDQVGLDPRVSAGHGVPDSKPCQFIPWREIESSRAGWADVIDFYARHNCDEYSFYGAYRFRSDPGPLPAHETTKAP
ncbi:MAG: hypothetical protein EXR72_25495 [Myxococcales bacterium]|nr:hypothetical protein [Myxococcales bacterium]